MTELMRRGSNGAQYANQEAERDCEAIQRAARCTEEGIKALSETYVYGEFKVSTAEEMVKRIRASKTAPESHNADDEQMHAIIRRRSFLNEVDQLMAFAAKETTRRVAQVAARDGTGRWPRFGR